MDIPTIQAEIQSEVQNIINILEKIQTELDELNSFTKPDGELDSVIKEGLRSSEEFFKMTGCSLNNKDLDLTELHTNINNTSTVRDSQCITTDGSTFHNNDTTQ